MAINSIFIENFKSVRKIKLEFRENDEKFHCYLGKNGAGKSNILKAIKYYFDSLDSNPPVEEIIDNLNPYSQKTKIAVIFDFKQLLKKKPTSILIIM